MEFNCKCWRCFPFIPATLSTNEKKVCVSLSTLFVEDKFIVVWLNYGRERYVRAADVDHNIVWCWWKMSRSSFVDEILCLQTVRKFQFINRVCCHSSPHADLSADSVNNGSETARARDGIWFQKLYHFIILIGLYGCSRSARAMQLLKKGVVFMLIHTPLFTVYIRCHCFTQIFFFIPSSLLRFVYFFAPRFLSLASWFFFFLCIFCNNSVVFSTF